MSNNNQNLANPQTNGTIFTMENAPVYVPKITLSGGEGGALQTASPAKTNIEQQAKKSSTVGLVYSIISCAVGVLSMVSIIICGFFSITGPGAFIPYGIGIVLCIIGIVLASLGRKEGDTTGLAKAGLIMNVIPLIALAALLTLLVVSIAACTAAFATCTSAASGAAALFL